MSDFVASTPMVPELAACHDSPHDHRKAIVVGLQVFLDLLQQGFVGKFNRTAQCEAQQFAAELLDELVAAFWAADNSASRQSR
ncbi:MAG: hypothetical protein CM1200mP2_51470 [Planctomycetaceae bacterium]|nr:MAG: hypothetical protein CM1200mP2_51470 [Planctomycetaceae bacterium]